MKLIVAFILTLSILYTYDEDYSIYQKKFDRAFYYIDIKEFDKAIDLLSQCYKYFKKYDKEIALGMIYTIANIYVEQNEPKKALKYYKRVIDSDIKNENTILSYSMITIIYYENHEYNNCISSSNKTLELLQLIKNSIKSKDYYSYKRKISDIQSKCYLRK